MSVEYDQRNRQFNPQRSVVVSAPSLLSAPDLFNGLMRWSLLVVFDHVVAGHASKVPKPGRITMPRRILRHFELRGLHSKPIPYAKGSTSRAHALPAANHVTRIGNDRTWFHEAEPSKKCSR
jgi:hypothetical protein